MRRKPCTARESITMLVIAWVAILFVHEAVLGAGTAAGTLVLPEATSIVIAESEVQQPAASSAGRALPRGDQYQSFPTLFLSDLSAGSFNATMRALPRNVQYVLMEFYAAWCPHCRHFALSMERLGATLNRGDGPVRVARVHCVAEPQLCSYYNISGFPTLKFGRVEAWQRMPTAETIETVEAEHAAEAVYRWVVDRVPQWRFPPLESGDAFASDFARVAMKMMGNTTGPAALYHRAQAWDIDMAMAMTMRNVFEDMPDDADARRALIDYSAMMCRFYPNSDCRPNMCELHSTLQQMFYGADVIKVSADMKNPHAHEDANELVRKKGLKILKDGSWKVCGRDWDAYSNGAYTQCRGTFPFTRGYTCGLWLTMHSLSAQMTSDFEANIRTLRNFIKYFFGCIECREHFLKFTEHIGSVKSQTDMMLWMWQTHNIVNMRVGMLEAQHEDGDPAFPKHMWPSPSECPECRIPIEPNPKAGKRGSKSVLSNPHGPMLDEGPLYRWDEGAVVNKLFELYSRPQRFQDKS